MTTQENVGVDFQATDPAEIERILAKAKFVGEASGSASEVSRAKDPMSQVLAGLDKINQRIDGIEARTAAPADAPDPTNTGTKPVKK